MKTKMMRTLRLGDRTISYDTGLDMVHTSGESKVKESNLNHRSCQVLQESWWERGKSVFPTLKLILVLDQTVLKTMRRWRMKGS